jgi:hypothetical protein
LAEKTSDNILALGIFTNFKAGCEYPMNENWGFVAESNLGATLFGAGSILNFNLLFGIYLSL